MSCLRNAVNKAAHHSFPLADAHSVPGYDPPMDFVVDREHLEWKIRHLFSTKI